MKRIYLITTKHLENGLWFRDEDDFRVAMNYIAIEAARHPEVIVLAFILMSNHTHFVLKGRRADVIAFVNSIKHRYSIYYRRKYGIKELLRRNTLDVREISLDNEGIEKVIAYVLMNCVAANICSHPSQYPWGTGALYFNPSPSRGRRLENLSLRLRTRILHSEEDCLPGDWILSEAGFILSSSYVDVAGVESVYRSPRRFNYFLNNSSKARMRLEAGESIPAFKDQIIMSALPDLLRSLFQKDSFRQLLPEEKSEMARQIRFRFSADATHIARVFGTTYAEAAQLLDQL